jgi:hypothetical protein
MAVSEKLSRSVRVHTIKVSPHSLALNIWLLDLQLHFLYLCNQCLSPLKWVWIPLRWGVLDTTLCNKVCQWLAAGWWFSVGSSTNPADRHDITEILLKVALNTINQTKPLLHYKVNNHCKHRILFNNKFVIYLNKCKIKFTSKNKQKI